ncbi:MAG: FecR/PupR family sigma factor regulator [Alphaproteobacteria bacterium]
MNDKGNILPFPDTAALESEAAAWVARFDAGDVSAKDQAAFQEWLNRSALHREAIAVYGNLWSEFDALRHLTDLPVAGRESAREDRPTRLKQIAPWLAAMCGGGDRHRRRRPGASPGRPRSLPGPAAFAVSAIL